jgi:hypothetical protein
VKDYYHYHGKGKLIFTDLGCTYEGEFKNNHPYGQGVFTKFRGTRLEGIFKWNEKYSSLLKGDGTITFGVYMIGQLEGKFIKLDVSKLNEVKTKEDIFKNLDYFEGRHRVGVDLETA